MGLFLLVTESTANLVWLVFLLLNSEFYPRWILLDYDFVLNLTASCLLFVRF